MAKEDFDLDKFLGEVEVEAGEVETIRKFFSRDKNKGFVLRQSEFDKKLNAAKSDYEAKVQSLADKQAALDSLMTQNIEYEGKARKSVEDYRVKTEKEVAKLKLQVAKAAELAGVEPDEIEVDEPREPRVKTPAVDLSELEKKFVGLDTINRLATGHINLTLDLDDIKDVHEDLVGKKMTRKEKETLLAEYNKDIAAETKAGRPAPPLMATADRLYEYSGKRSELEKGKLAKIVAEAEAKGYQKRITEEGDQGLPAPRRTGTGSVLFTDKTRKAGDPVVRDRGVKLALEALNKQAAA